MKSNRQMLNNASASFSTASVLDLSDAGVWNWMIKASAWSGASAVLEFSPDDGTTWFPYDGTIVADGGLYNIPIGGGKVRVNITGSPTGVSSWLTLVG